MSQVAIVLDGEDDVNETSDLKKWIERERLDSVENIEQESRPPEGDEMGPSLLAVLGVVLGAKATVELVKSIHKWIETRKRKVKITVKTDGKEVIIDCESPESVSEIARGLGIEI